MTETMCPHCGALFKWTTHLIPVHFLLAEMCPGSQQIGRNPESDARFLWNGERNPHVERVGDR